MISIAGRWSDTTNYPVICACRLTVTEFSEECLELLNSHTQLTHFAMASPSDTVIWKNLTLLTTRWLIFKLHIWSGALPGKESHGKKLTCPIMTTRFA